MPIGSAGIDQGAYLGAESPSDPPIAWSSPAFRRRRYAGGRAQWSVDHRGIRCRRLRRDPEIPAPTHTLAQRLNRRWTFVPSPNHSGRSRHGIPVRSDRAGLHEQTIVRCGHSDRAFAPGQQVLDPLPLVIAQSEPPHWSAPHKLTAHESKNSPCRNRSRIMRCRLKAECGNRDSPVQHSVRVAPTDRSRLIDDRP